MGSRGAFEKSNKSGIHEDFREYKEIDKIGEYKVLKWTISTNNRTITYSNMPDTIYYSYKEKTDRIEKIYFYKNHCLHRSIDLEIDKNTPHAHKWTIDDKHVGRISHDTNNTFKLNSNDIKFYNLAIQWNERRRKR